MTTRRQWHLSALSAVVSAALLVACGGGGSDEELKVGKVVSFGDSLSDLGTYTIATSQVPGVAPYFGGRFTTNTHTTYTAANTPLSNTATIWVEWVAAKAGVPITQAAVGFATTNIPCPAAANPALATSCTGYAQGGSRVTDPIGVNHAGGFLTVPVVTQIANHLARFTTFESNDLVFVWAGTNDLFIQSGAVQAGALAPATAIANMETAGTELAVLVKEQILAKGAKRVAVMNVPDVVVTPEYSSLPVETKAFVTQLSAAFNTKLTEGLAGSNARFIDVRTLINDVANAPSKYGFTNTTTPACDLTKSRGTSLGCNAAPAALFTAAGLPNLNTMKPGTNASTWAFADGVHPTTGGHKVIGDFVVTNIKNFGWIPPNL